MMEPAAVRAVSVTQSDVPLDVSAVGNVESMASVDVKSRVAGQVLRVAFEEGQNVTKGQLLFEIDPEPIHRQLAEIQANLSKDIALEEQAKANVSKDEAQIKQTAAAADRGLQLAKEGIFSKEQTEQVVATNDSAQAALEADNAAITSAEASLKADRARLAQTQLQLNYTSITAPITGRAGAISVKAGNLIKDNDAVMVTLLQMSPIYVTFGLPEQLLPQLHQGLQIMAASKFGGCQHRNHQDQSQIRKSRSHLVAWRIRQRTSAPQSRPRSLGDSEPCCPNWPARKVCVGTKSVRRNRLYAPGRSRSAL